jgi:hypothetical protein
MHISAPPAARHFGGSRAASGPEELRNSERAYASTHAYPGLAGALGGAGWRPAARGGPAPPGEISAPRPAPPSAPAQKGEVITPWSPGGRSRPWLARPGFVQVTTEQSVLDSLAKVPSDFHGAAYLAVCSAARAQQRK